MLNAEKYKKEILEVSEDNKCFMVDKITKKVFSCEEINYCLSCLFYDSDIDCTIAKAKWLVSECNAK